MELDIWVYLVFFFVALVYSSVGFGGGSSYLAILSALGSEMSFIRISAYLCNMMVTGKSSVAFVFKKWINIKSSWPWLIGSVPFAFIGGAIKLEQVEFFSILGVALILAAIVMVVKRKVNGKHITQLGKIFIGVCIGLLSGLVGIGGGIFLAPILHIYGWKDEKAIAGTSAIFIFFNATAGFSGYIYKNPNFEFPLELAFLLIAVFLGSVIGTRLVFAKFHSNWIRQITAILVLIVGLKLLWNNLLLPLL